MSRETVGKLATDLLQKAPDTRDPIELQREMQKDYETQVVLAIERGKKMFSTDFYVVVETKKEQKLVNVVRNYFFPRQSCPTPNTDQTVYRYIKDRDLIEFLWVIPSKDTCEMLYHNALQVVDEEKKLLGYVMAYYNGVLLRIAKSLNAEQDDTPLLQEK